MNAEIPESFVDSDEAAKFLSLTRRRILDLARAGKLPGHPIGDGSRRVWRFRLSELAAAITSSENSEFISQQRARMVRAQTVSRDCD
jgi:excisionase family DNA binding protein